MSDRPKPASIATVAEMLCFLLGITQEELDEVGGVTEPSEDTLARERARSIRMVDVEEDEPLINLADKPGHLRIRRVRRRTEENE